MARNKSRRGGANQVVGMPAPKPSWSALFKRETKNVPFAGFAPPAPALAPAPALGNNVMAGAPPLALERHNGVVGGKKRKTHRRKSHRRRSHRR